MPIRAENKARYPKEWSQISKAIRERAGHQCEGCGVPDQAMIRRGTSIEGIPVWRLASSTAYEDGQSAIDGETVPDTGEDTAGWGPIVKAVLTVAHLDHQPENCEPANLRAWCQRCHNVYDAPMRRRGNKSRAKAAQALGDLL